MSMNAAELGLRRTGNPKDLEYADRIAEILRERGSDIPLPHTFAHPHSSEVAPVEIVRFTHEAREALVNEGYIIHELSGLSIKSFRDEGRPFWSDWHNSYPELEAMPSRSSEVAINPAHLFLPDSNRKTLKEQEQMVNEFSNRLANEVGVKDVEAIIGEMPDYVDLVFTHFAATGVRLFGKDFGYYYARTKTQTVGSDVALVGNFGAVKGLNVNCRYRGNGYNCVFASPLVVPKQ